MITFEHAKKKEFNEWNEMARLNNQLNPSRQSHKGRKLVWFGKVFSSFNQILVLPFHVDSTTCLVLMGRKGCLWLADWGYWLSS